MEILVAIDSIKDFENSIEIGAFFKEELRECNVRTLPFLDGGKGTVEVMKSVINGSYEYVNLHNPLNEVITARYVKKGDLAIMEMAESSGLRLIYKEELNVLESSSLGFGEMLRDGLDKGCRKFFIGIGDTAPHDMGMGMLYSLGVRYYDKDGNDLNPAAKNMVKVETIDFRNMDRRLFESKILLATSLNMTLFGKNSFLDTRPIRKGAKKNEIIDLAKGSKHFFKCVSKAYEVEEIDFPSLGSGGGVAWALYTVCRAKVQNSMDLILELVDFESLIKGKDVLILGEDVEEFQAQSSINLAKLAKRYKPDIRVIFLEDEKSDKLEKTDVIDKIYDYKIDDYVDRNDYKDEIKRIARELYDKDLFKSLEKIC
ncbi:MAG: glycerate kinase [Peptoniphilaceae bacterium]|nr:glycerate kinase [Peptoniphilaceae bacterium]MDY6019539.1 glycerate kinase [Anaerococcus sp.]